MLRTLLRPFTPSQAFWLLGFVRAGVLSWAVAGLATLLVACGGGGGGGGSPQVGPTSNDGVPRIEPYERTASMSAVQLRSLSIEPAAPAVVPARVVLEPLGGIAPDTSPRTPSQPVRIGVERELVATASSAALTSWLDWQPLASGGRAAALTFRSEGAAGLRLALRVERLPARAVLRLFGSDGGGARITGSEVLEGLARSAAGSGMAPGADLYWLPPANGEEVTIQIELPPGVLIDTVAIAVPRLSHLWWSPASARSSMEPVFTKAAGSCQIDANCESAWSWDAKSIARLVFQSGGESKTCTGTLMADLSVSGIPYFLTAYHCVRNQTEADSVVTYWFYRSTACNSGVGSTPIQVTGGATMLYPSAESDVSFMRLNQNPPIGAVHAGSLVGQPAIKVGVGTLHHPKGSWLHFSEGTITSYADCDGTLCGPLSDPSGNFLRLQWSRGVTEPGSSGSPIFATVSGKHYVVGHLFAGNSACPTPQDPNADKNYDYYGRLDRAYPSLKTWLGTVPGT